MTDDNSKDKALDEFLSLLPKAALESGLEGLELMKRIEQETDPARRAELEKLLDKEQDRFIMKVYEETPHGELN